MFFSKRAPQAKGGCPDTLTPPLDPLLVSNSSTVRSTNMKFATFVESNDVSKQPQQQFCSAELSIIDIT